MNEKDWKYLMNLQHLLIDNVILLTGRLSIRFFINFCLSYFIVIYYLYVWFICKIVKFCNPSVIGIAIKLLN